MFGRRERPRWAKSGYKELVAGEPRTGPIAGVQFQVGCLPVEAHICSGIELQAVGRQKSHRGVERKLPDGPGRIEIEIAPQLRRQGQPRRHADRSIDQVGQPRVVAAAIAVSQDVDLRAEGHRYAGPGRKADRRRNPAFDLAIADRMMRRRQFHERDYGDLRRGIGSAEPPLIAHDDIANPEERSRVPAARLLISI